MTQPVLAPIEACVFHAYGTLFDVHSAVVRCRPAGPEVEIGDLAALPALRRGA